MNAATRGIILAVVAVALGVLILSQGFDDPDAIIASEPAPAPSDDGGSDGGSGDDAAPADGSADDGDADGAADSADGTSDADSGTADQGSDDQATGDDTGSETPTTPPDDGPPDILHPPTDVRVLVVNGTTVQGAAGTINNQLIALGFNGLPPTNTEPVGTATETVVYYAEGFLLDAQDIALDINASAAAVQPVPADVPVAGLAELEANVVIIIGPDLASPG